MLSMPATPTGPALSQIKKVEHTEHNALKTLQMKQIKLQSYVNYVRAYVGCRINVEQARKVQAQRDSSPRVELYNKPCVQTFKFM